MAPPPTAPLPQTTTAPRQQQRTLDRLHRVGGAGLEVRKALLAGLKGGEDEGGGGVQLRRDARPPLRRGHLGRKAAGHHKVDVKQEHRLQSSTGGCDHGEGI